NIYIGSNSSPFSKRVTIGRFSSYNLGSFAPGNTYYIAISAVTGSGLESDLSNIVALNIPAQSDMSADADSVADTDGDGIPNYPNNDPAYVSNDNSADLANRSDGLQNYFCASFYSNFARVSSELTLYNSGVFESSLSESVSNSAGSQLANWSDILPGTKVK